MLHFVAPSLLFLMLLPSQCTLFFPPHVPSAVCNLKEDSQEQQHTPCFYPALHTVLVHPGCICRVQWSFPFLRRDGHFLTCFHTQKHRGVEGDEGHDPDMSLACDACANPSLPQTLFLCRCHATDKTQPPIYFLLLLHYTHKHWLFYLPHIQYFTVKVWVLNSKT